MRGQAVTVNYVTLTCDYFDGAGNLLNGGTATFTPTSELTDATDHERIPLAPVTVTFKPMGSPTARLLATDNANVLPSGWAWLVTFSGVSGSPASFQFFLPFSGGASQFLSALAALPAGSTSLLAENAQQILAEG